MSFFDRFRKKVEPPKTTPSPRPISLPLLSYRLAYRILPYYAFKASEKLIEKCTATGKSAGAVFYVLACQEHKIEPIKEDSLRFHFHSGRLDEAHEYYAFEYPTPPPVDLFDPTKQPDSGKPVLAPHFSIVVRHNQSGAISYYVLGQAPSGGRTTLRSVTAEGLNRNHGPGPEPTLDAFLAVLRTTGGKLPIIASTSAQGITISNRPQSP